MLVLTAAPASAQGTSPAAPQAAAALPEPPPPASIPKNQWDVQAENQESVGKLHKLHGNAWVESSHILLRGDDIDWDEETGDLHASGHVYLRNFQQNEQVWCDQMEYNTEQETGKFYNVHGEMVPRIITRPGILTSHSPFFFQGEWAERAGGIYVLHHGYITNCKMPAPWWRLRGPKFVIVPGEKALAYRSTFLLRGVPLFFTPYFYHSLEKEPRKSGFLTPNISNSSIGGFTLGIGYFWAINRSYDLTYRFLDYTSRGLAHHLEFSGKPRPGTDFYAILYGVQDRGVAGAGPTQTYSGLSIHAAGKSDMGDGWTAHTEVNYVTSFRFVQEWSQSYSELLGSETHSVGFVNKNWPTDSLDVIVARLENFQTVEVAIPPGGNNYVANAVIIRKLPEAEFSGRDQPIWGNLPLWFSWDSSGGLLYRSEPVFNSGLTQLIDRVRTGELMTRENLAPHITGAFHLGDFLHFVPSLGLHETFYGQGQTQDLSVQGQTQYQDTYQTTGTKILRSAEEFSLDVILPTISRVYAKKTFLGDKLKHVIEPRATYRYVTGVGSDFDKFIRFDETELLSNTNDLLLSVTNRIYAKRGDSVQEIVTWELGQKRYFDPTFGGALIPGQRNVFESTADLSAFAFLAGPRGVSPVVSSLRLSPVSGFAVRWQADYDPRVHGVVDSTVALDYRFRKKYFASIANSLVRLNPILTPAADQYGFRVGYGDVNRTGWNGYITVNYDQRTGVVENTSAQVTYNTDCCGLSVQYYRFNVGLRDETGWRFAFAIGNVGTFGTLKKQDRTF
jgi:LPS-assembly protein